MLVNSPEDQSLLQSTRRRPGFAEDFRRFFVRGLAALLPTLITLSVVWYVLNFLWESLGQYLILLIKWVWSTLAEQGLVAYYPAGHIGRYWNEDLNPIRTRVVGVLLAILAVYIVGLLVGNLIGRTFWIIGERLVMKIPIIRAIYPAVKQVTDFVLAERKHQFEFSRVVAVQPHEQAIWSIGLVTGSGVRELSDIVGEEMLTVFVPSTPTAFTGYVLVVPRKSVVELPLTVEQAMRLLVSGGVISPDSPETVESLARKRIARSAPEPPSASPDAATSGET